MQRNSGTAPPSVLAPYRATHPIDSPVVGVSRIADDGHFLHEVLGAGRSTYADLRAGATRLLEIGHTLPAPADRLYPVLSEPLAEAWSADTVSGVFGVQVPWRTSDSGGGHGAETAPGEKPRLRAVTRGVPA
ncbi:hypothetical protein LUW75_06235 [Streptomyces sp. MRC013]|uniref:hypothetical protein n=1 Tax=Streptomyces sp. MRC013 TaxID=2898276 RepID=UPI00202752A4|nr:hypothetical protein [Streptomyces sp. MRC013]URM89658.1 hypothetical protein LUW75_06235 [Streptomyces sp. MRC013]